MDAILSNAVRPPAVAGRFYPRETHELSRLVGALLSGAGARAGPIPKALIVPHAGYVFSGPIAASAYARWLGARGVIQRVVMLGPSHFVEVEGLATVSVRAFATPLGEVPVDAAAVASALTLPQVGVMDESHATEHSLEVQLPFLQSALGDFKLVPFAVGEANSKQIGEVLELLWGGPETGIVVSSDLSHYHDAPTARRLDCATAEAIEAMEPDRIREFGACGRAPIRGLLEAARRRGLSASTLDLRNSSDTAGPRNRVVGYGAFAFAESPSS
jgi:AmmeMemoRadiSam system protein B